MVTYQQQIQERAGAIAAAQADIDIIEKEQAKTKREIERFRVSPKFSRKERREFTRLQLRRHVGERRAAKRAALRTFAQEQARIQAEISPVRAQMGELGTQIHEIQEYQYGADLFWRQADQKFAPFDPRMSEAAKKGFRRAAEKKKAYDFPTVPIGDINVRMPRAEYYKLKDLPLTAELSGKIIKRFAPTKYPKYVSQRIGTLSLGRISISPGAISKFQRSGIGLTWAGKRFSPLPLELALGSEVARASRASTIVPTTEAMPKMMSSEASSRQRIIKALEFKQSLFTVGKTRNPKTWTNLDPITKLRERIRERVKGYTAKGLTIRELPGIPKVLSAPPGKELREEVSKLAGVGVTGLIKLRDIAIPKETPTGALTRIAGQKFVKGFEEKVYAPFQERIQGRKEEQLIQAKTLVETGLVRETVIERPSDKKMWRPTERKYRTRYKLDPGIKEDPLSPTSREKILWQYPVAGATVLTGMEQEKITKATELKGETVAKELESSKFATDLQESVGKGLLSVEEAQELYQKEFQKKMKPFQEKAQKEFEKKALEIQEGAMWKKFVKKDLPTIISIGIPLTVASYYIPGVGYALGAGFGLGFATMPEKQYRQMAKYPLLTAAYVGAWAGTGAITAGALKGAGFPQIKPFTPKLYKGTIRPPKLEFIGFKKGKIVTITKTYPAWKGTLESPFMRGLRKVPIIKKLKPPKAVTISGKVQYKALVKLKPVGKGKATGTVEMWRVPRRGAPKSVTYATIKGTQKFLKTLEKQPKFIKDLSKKLTRKGVETQVAGGRGKTQLEFKMVRLKKGEFKLAKPLKKALADVEVTKIVRVTDVGKGKFKYTLFDPRTRTVKGTIIGKSAKLKSWSSISKSVFEELGVKKLTSLSPRIRKIDYMRGRVYKGKVPIAFDIVTGKYKFPKGKLIGKAIVKLPASLKQKIPLWERGFPKDVGKLIGRFQRSGIWSEKAQVQLPFSRTTPRRFQQQLQLEPQIPKPTSKSPQPPLGLFPELSIKAPFKTLTPIAAGASLLFPRYTPRIPSRFISPTTTTFFPIIKTEVLQRPQIKLGLQPVITPISLTGIKPIVITGQAPRQAQAQAQAISQLQIPLLRTALIQRPILQQRQVQRQVLRRPIITTTPFILFPTPSRGRKISKKKKKFVPAYRTYIIKRGKKVFLKGKYERGEAIKKGAIVTRETIAATFVVQKKGKIKVRRRAPSFTPDPQRFRSYRIKKGKRIPLKDVWIERAPRRLETKAEIAAVVRGRRRKIKEGGRRLRWF